MEDKIQKLVHVYQALDTLTIKGFSNCATLAGSMQILSEVIQEMRVSEPDGKQE